MLLSAVLLLVAADPAFGRPIQDISAWQREKHDLLSGFSNMYQPCVREIPGQDYRYKMWFFGWAVGVGNKGYPGCDAIFHARSKDLRRWEIYSGEGRWDYTMNPKLWVPVITADNKPYDAWHNGDPSVVYKDGRFYMAFTATGKPERVPFHLTPMLSCVMGATSQDGIHWKKSKQPFLIEPPEMQHPKDGKGWTGEYARPSLMWDQGKWRLWFDYWQPGGGTCMGYAENTGVFDEPCGFKILRAGDNPLIVQWTNPEVVKVGNRYHSFADPPGYPGKRQSPNHWTSRQLCEAVSDDGLRWAVVGFISPDDDAPACHVPQALVTVVDGKSWLYLFYATQRGGEPKYDFRYDRIRAMRREITRESIR
jgi:hypothetical protein